MAVELPGEAGPAEELHHLDARLVARIGGRDPRGARGKREPGVFVRERPGRVPAVRAGDLEHRVEVRHAVLDGLERADRASEGVPVENLLAGEVERALRGAELLEGQEDRGPVEDPADEIPAVLAPAVEGFGGGGVEREARRGAGGVDRLLHRPGGPSEVREGKDEPPRIVARENEGDVRGRSVGGSDLGSRQRRIAAKSGPHVLRSDDTARLGEGEGPDPVAVREAGKVAVLLLVGPREEDRFRHRGGGDEGDRGEGPAELLGDQHELRMAEAASAPRLRDDRPEPAHLRGSFPELAAHGRLGLEDRAGEPEGGVVLEIVARGGPEELLLLREVEVHRDRLRAVVPAVQALGRVACMEGRAANPSSQAARRGRPSRHPSSRERKSR